MRFAPLIPVAALLASLPAAAQVLLPGGVVSNPGGGIDNQASIGGTTQGTDIQGFSSGSLFGGVTSVVYASDPGNPNGGLTFAYQLNNLGTDNVLALTIPGFTGLTVNVATHNGIGITDPVAASRSGGLGAEVTFHFTTPFSEIPQGGSSQLVLAHSSGLSFGTVTGTISGPGGTASVALLGPVAVPEPGEFAAVAGLGLAGLAIWRRWKV